MCSQTTWQPYGFHLSDGALYTYVDGTEYRDIAAAWDWNRIPGITTTNKSPPLLGGYFACGNSSFTGLEDFVGGVSDGSRGIAVMKYVNPSSPSLSWQKTWFFLDEDVQHVVISGINYTGNAQPISVLDQKAYSSQTGVFVDGNQISPTALGTGSGGSLPDTPITTTLWHGAIGYYFPNNQVQQKSYSARVSIEEKTGSWAKIGASTQPPIAANLFTATIGHLNTSTSAEYTIFPGTTDHTQFQSKLDNLNLITSSNLSVTSLYDYTHQTIYLVFWDDNGGSYTFNTSRSTNITIRAPAGCALIYNIETGNVTLADPTQKSINIQIVLSVSGTPPSIWPETSGSQDVNLSFVLPSSGQAGDSSYLVVRVNARKSRAYLQTNVSWVLSAQLFLVYVMLQYF